MPGPHKYTGFKMIKSKELEIGRAGEYFAVFSLISQGYTSYLSDQGLAYDILVDVDGTVMRGKVKSTLRKGDFGKSKNAYRFGTRRAKKSTRLAMICDCDFYAFVSIEDKKVAFILSKNLESKINPGSIVQTIDFSSKDFAPTTKKRVDGENRKGFRKNIEDFEYFYVALKGLNND